MKMKYLLLAATLVCFNASAKDSTLDAALGGGIGGAIGAAVGNEIGGKQGAVIGGAIGGGVGASVTTDGETHEHESAPAKVYVEPSHSHGFCPPGQAKKGNC